MGEGAVFAVLVYFKIPDDCGEQHYRGFHEEITLFLYPCAVKDVLATHSPFLLAIPGARIYDLDSDPVRTRRWTELESVRDTFEFFQQHKEEF